MVASPALKRFSKKSSLFQRMKCGPLPIGRQNDRGVSHWPVLWKWTRSCHPRFRLLATHVILGPSAACKALENVGHLPARCAPGRAGIHWDVGGVLAILNSTSFHKLIGWEGEDRRQIRLDPRSPTVRSAPRVFFLSGLTTVFRFRSVFKGVGRHITDWSNPYGPDSKPTRILYCIIGVLGGPYHNISWFSRPHAMVFVFRFGGAGLKGSPPEVEANISTSELLMPTFLFQPLAEDAALCLQTISGLAGRFNRSLTATGMKLRGFGFGCACLPQGICSRW